MSTDYFNSFDWSPDGKWIAATNVSADRATAQIGLIAVADGSFRRLKSLGNPRNVLASANNKTCVRVSPDGKYIAYDRPPIETDLQHDVFVLAIDRSREIPAIVHSADDRVMGWSPDGTRLLFRSDFASSIPATKTASLLIVPVAGGQPRELLRLSQPDAFLAGAGPAWTPDSRAVLFVKEIGARREFWLVSVADDRPRKLDIDPDIWLKGTASAAQWGFSLSPDGHRIAFQVGTNASEVWALENFLPSAARDTK